MKTDGETSLAITAEVAGERGRDRNATQPSQNISQGLISRELSLSVNFLTLFISRRRCEDSFACYYLLPYRVWGEGRAERRRKVEGQEGNRGANLSERGWRAIIANNKRESHLIIMIVRLLSVAPSNNFVSR